MGCQLPGFCIEPLEERHSREAFCCGNEIIDTWVRGRSLKDHLAYKLRVQVASCENQEAIVGFYALGITTLGPKRIGGSIGSKFGKRPIPAVYLSMIGSEATLQGNGIGTDLMLHAFRTTLDIADMAGTACLTLNAVDAETAVWYEDRSFKRFSPDELGMYIPLATVRAACEAAAS